MPHQYLEWQAKRINEIVRAISMKIRQVDPGIIISVDSEYVAPGQLHPQGRNHRVWLENGWIDLALMMDYKQRISVKSMQSERHLINGKRCIYPIVGNYDWREDVDGRYRPRKPERFIRLVELSVRCWPGVASVYLAEQLDKAQINALRHGPFNESASIDWNIILNRN
jgi:uncharacterized lipoprotein YddW (UPF0748 family)